MIDIKTTGSTIKQTTLLSVKLASMIELPQCLDEMQM